MKTIILLDLSGSFMYTPTFNSALKQIKKLMKTKSEKNLEVYGFALKKHKLTPNDIDTLIEAFVDRKGSRFDAEDIVAKHLGLGTNFKSIKATFEESISKGVSKVVIYSDFVIDYRKRL